MMFRNQEYTDIFTQIKRLKEEYPDLREAIDSLLRMSDKQPYYKRIVLIKDLITGFEETLKNA